MSVCDRDHTTRTVVNKFGEKDDEERRDEIVDTLHVATGGMSYRPYVQNAFEDLQRVHGVRKERLLSD